MSDADILRAQIATSTDPDRLEREARRREGTSGPMVLCVGGPRDGKWIEDHGPSIIGVSVAHPLAETLPINEPVFHIEHYRREMWRGRDVDGLSIFVHQSLTMAGALLRLMVHYRPPSPRRRRGPPARASHDR